MSQDNALYRRFPRIIIDAVNGTTTIDFLEASTLLCIDGILSTGKVESVG